MTDKFQGLEIYILMGSLTTCVTGLSSNIYFPTLTKTLGYGTTETLFLAAPLWIFSCLLALANSTHSDRTNEKFWHSTWPLIIMYTWMSSSFPRPPPPPERAVALAFMNAMSQVGNIVGSYIWPTKFGPIYANSYGIVLSMFGATILLIICLQRAAALESTTVQDAMPMQKGFGYLI
ncbi:uncharacterized protein IAS62_001346 [Cryptococcus decagattii]|uniref:Uncharacterized protein n=1 Tax=Cryptococcus decagattii TaxID=1859122 RepID=A0ABZ2AS79_9TREE